MTPPFPIDFVWTWCGSESPQMARKIQSFKPAPTAYVCRRTHDLVYSLRSACQNAPWFRHAVLVIDDDEQLPKWLAVDHPKLRVVKHSEFMPMEILPNFNSNIIESYLHLIPDLSEHFLYFNDDTYVKRPVKWQAFFTRSGRPIHRHYPGAGFWGKVPKDASLFMKTWCRWEKRYRALDHHTQHQVQPVSKALLQQYWPRFHRHLQTARLNRFRDISDVNVLRLTIALSSQNGDAVRKTTNKTEVFFECFDKKGIESLLTAKRPVVFFCINNCSAGDSHVYRVLKTLFPKKCVFELRRQRLKDTA